MDGFVVGPSAAGAGGPWGLRPAARGASLTPSRPAWREPIVVQVQIRSLHWTVCNGYLSDLRRLTVLRAVSEYGTVTAAASGGSDAVRRIPASAPARQGVGRHAARTAKAAGAADGVARALLRNADGMQGCGSARRRTWAPPHTANRRAS